MRQDPIGETYETRRETRWNPFHAAFFVLEGEVLSFRWRLSGKKLRVGCHTDLLSCRVLAPSRLR